MKFCLGAMFALLVSFSANAYAVAISSCESEYDIYKLTLEQVNDDILISLANKDYVKQADESIGNEPKLKLGAQETGVYKVYNTKLQDFAKLTYTPRTLTQRLILGNFNSAGNEDMSSGDASALVSRLSCK
ncbi:hypothetical protein [Bdellovibrio reynosensis]|uniref:Uncharacterized protein n=1 Tax=Bdellovibrio reynosensis TaxID=2835041 RepID=A0ABY4CCE8_9BACT|nr:hypothetical protein [Bdellovibrio reynosensis]UOF02394.1 hypothetical protein MNR06_05445 [Bdellovibrio reynosensis]